MKFRVLGLLLCLLGIGVCVGTLLRQNALDEQMGSSALRALMQSGTREGMQSSTEYEDAKKKKEGLGAWLVVGGIIAGIGAAVAISAKPGRASGPA